MKRSPALLISLGLLLLCLSSFCVDQASASGALFCNTKCKVRCAKAGYMDRCRKYCGMCCDHCHCVPSGTFGNKDECPCYRDMLSRKKKPKCP